MAQAAGGRGAAARGTGVARIAAASILLTGGSGTLGSELQPLLPGVVAPTHGEMDVCDPDAVLEFCHGVEPAVIVHAAAYTDVAAAEHERSECWRVNVGGSRAVVAAARAVGARLVHISTDYVFYGDAGNYREDDPPGPVRNYYALSKLAAEEVARTLPRTLVLRTSFRPRAWPYPVAYTDLVTSQDYVDIVAPDIALAVRSVGRIPYDTLHVATERKSVYELARRRRPDVRAGTKAEASVALPDDITLDTTRWRELKASLTT